MRLGQGKSQLAGWSQVVGPDAAMFGDVAVVVLVVWMETVSLGCWWERRKGDGDGDRILPRVVVLLVATVLLYTHSL